MRKATDIVRVSLDEMYFTFEGQRYALLYQELKIYYGDEGKTRFVRPGQKHSSAREALRVGLLMVEFEKRKAEAQEARALEDAAPEIAITEVDCQWHSLYFLVDGVQHEVHKGRLSVYTGNALDTKLVRFSARHDAIIAAVQKLVDHPIQIYK